jgi:hypothetical protein
MDYVVIADEFYVAEFDILLLKDDTFADGDAEPDLVANLLARGIVEPEGGYPPPKPVKRAAKVESAEDE